MEKIDTLQAGKLATDFGLTFQDAQTVTYLLTIVKNRRNSVLFDAAITDQYIYSLFAAVRLKKVGGCCVDV